MDDSKAKWEQARALKEAGKSYSEIADEMGYASKNSITKLFKKAETMKWSQEKPEEDPNEE